MATVTQERYALEVEWWDPNPGLVKKYQLFYYPADESVEMYDTKNHRPFLKRCKFPLKVSDFFIGSTITVFSRALKVVGYCDEYTQRALKRMTEKVVVVAPFRSLASAAQLLSYLQKELGPSAALTQLRLVSLSPAQEDTFYSISKKEIRGRVLAFELQGERVLSNTQTLVSKQHILSEAVASSSDASAEGESTFFFGERASRFLPEAAADTLPIGAATVCVIKPHAVAAGAVGPILEAIAAAGFGVTALELFRMAEANAEEFLEVYKTVVPEYAAMVKELSSGPCVAMEVVLADTRATASSGTAPRGRTQSASSSPASTARRSVNSTANSENSTADDTVVARFRELCGPVDPEVGKLIRPASLRARFGVDRVQNAVHCTDLVEDGPLESEYFFKLLQPQ